VLTWTGSLRVFLALEACDLRLGFEGLSGLVQTRLGEVARSGALFVFTNKPTTPPVVVGPPAPARAHPCAAAARSSNS